MWSSSVQNALTHTCSTTSHLERLDPTLSTPDRMNVWVEFKNFSKWQAEALFRNFVPSTDQDYEVLEGDMY
jgi:chaperone BCS1